MLGRSVDAYRAPLFIAWQLTNRCSARCLACCEESGPAAGWHDELSRDAALGLARRIAEEKIPYVAFGGGEPLGIPHAWEIFDILARAGVALKIETDGTHIDDAAADRLAELKVDCVQISVDGATAETHSIVRPGGNFDAAIAAIRRLVARDLPPQFVFVPTRLNLHEIVDAWDLAAELGCSAFITGPLMRIGRAARDWERLGPSAESWQLACERLRERAACSGPSMALSIYPWDIVTEAETRLESPQAMLLVVPNGKVKLLNALPFAPADLRTASIEQAWDAYRAAWHSDAVRDFIHGLRGDPTGLLHANATWDVG